MDHAFARKHSFARVHKLAAQRCLIHAKPYLIWKTSENAAANLFRSENRRRHGIFFRQTLWLVQEALVFGDVEKLLCERRGFTRGAGVDSDGFARGEIEL